jgi:hypothetical protein
MAAKAQAPDGAIAPIHLDVVSFLDTGAIDPLPGQLVSRLIVARSLLHANVTLSPRLAPGDSAAAHVIVLDDLEDAVIAAERLVTHGFRLDTLAAPPSVCFTVRSSHDDDEIRALIFALTIVVRELYATDPDDSGTSISRCKTRELGER